MPQQPNGNLLGRNKHAFKPSNNMFTGFSFTVNFISPTIAPGGTEVRILNNNIDYYTGYYDSLNTTQDYTLIGDGGGTILNPQFIVVSVYNDDRNPYLEGLIDAAQVKFEFRTNSGNHPFDVNNWAYTHSVIADGDAINLLDGYWNNPSNNPYNAQMFYNLPTTGISSAAVLACGLHPGRKGNWSSSSNRYWAMKRTFMTKMPAMSAPLDVSVTGNEANRYLQMRMLYWDAFNASWTSSDWIEHGVLINNNVASTPQMYIYDIDTLSYSAPVHRSLILPYLDTSKAGYMPAGDNLTHGETLFNSISDLTGYQCFALQGGINDGLPGSDVYIDVVRQATFNGANAGVGTTCLQLPLGDGTTDGLYKKKLIGSQTEGVTYDTVSSSTSLIGATGVYNQTTSCTTGQAFQSNSSTAGGHYHIDLTKFYMYTEFLRSVIDPTNFGGPGSGNTQFGSNMIAYNSPKCWSQSEWMNDYVRIGFIPAPTNQGGGYTTVKMKPKLTTPTGTGRMYVNKSGTIGAFPHMTGWSAYTLTGTMSGGTSLQTGGSSNFTIIEPKSFCTFVIANHEAIYCLELYNINFGSINATCSSNGSLKVDFNYTYGPDWSTKGPDTWTVPIAFKIWDQVNSSWYSTLIFNITDSTSAGPQTATLAGVPPGTYVLTTVDVGPVKSNQYYNMPGQVFDGAGQVQLSAYMPGQSEDVSGGTRNPLLPVLTATDVSCLGGQDGTITALIGGGQGFTPPTTVICSPGSLGAGSTTLGPTNAGFVTFNNLNAGVHTLDFTDGAGCTYTDTIQVTQPSSLLGATEAWTHPTTCVESDGTITLTPSNGVPTYTVQWTNPQGNVTGTTGLTHTGCQPGTWGWILTDSSGCPSANGTVTLTAPSSGITITAVTTDPTSSGATDGTLDISVALPASITTCSSGASPSVSWTTTAVTGTLTGNDITCNPWPPTSTTLNYTGLAAGTVTITAEFGAKPSGCSETITVTLADASTLTASAIGNVILCNGTNNGEVVVSVSGGSSTNFHHYEFLLCDDVGMTTNCIGPFSSSTSPYTFTGLSAGTYYATVTDWFGASGTIQGQTSAANSATVASQTGTTTVWTVTDAPCAGGLGKITLTSVSGGSSPYQYYSTPSSTGMTSGPIPWVVGTFTTFAADTYEMITEDANGCQEVQTIVVGAAGSLVLGTLTPSDATCGLNNDGTLAFTATTGGTGTLTYKIIDAGGSTIATQTTTATFTGLASGAYIFSVTDTNGCTIDQAFTIGITTMTLSTTKSDQSCNHPPSNDGSIDLTVTGGVAAFTYAWTGPSGFTSSTEDISSLAVGTYNVTVTDSNGCTDSTSVDILQSSDTLENLSVTEVVSACPGGCAGVVVDVNGGDFPLFLEISDDGGATWTRVSVTASTTAAQFNENFPSPAFGAGITINAANYWKENSTSRFCFTNGTTYSFRTISVTNSCPSNVLTWNPSPSNYVAQTLTETLIQPTCCGCNNAACNGAINVVINDGVPIAQGAAGVPGVLSFDWVLKKDGIDISTLVTYNTSCNGGCSSTEYNEIDFTDLYPGSYEFTSTDDCGETVTETWVIIDPRIYITDIVTSDQLCANGCADGTITITATGGSSGVLQYSIDDGINWSASNVFTGVGQGTWRIWVRDPMCGAQILFDPTDNVLTSDPGCYSDFVNGIWPAGTEASLSAVSALDMQLISTTHNSLPGSSDGVIVVNLTAGTAPYEISIVPAATSTPFDSCTAQTSGVLTPGLTQYININGLPVSPTGITNLAAAGTITIDNLSVATDWSSTALEAWYRVTVKDSTGCISSVETLIDNGTLGIIGIYGATDCDCNCPEGYGLITPPPAPPALPCAGLVDVPPIDNGTLNTTNTIAQFGAANTYAPGYGTPNGGVLYVDSVSNNATVFISTADTFYKGVSANPLPYNMQFTGSANLLIPAVDAMGVVMQYGTIFDTRLADIGVWLQQGPTVPAVPTNEWLGIPIEIDFASQANTILGIACHGNYRVSLDCALLITSETIGGTQAPLVDTNNYSEYSMFPIAIPAGKHTLLIEVKNSTLNTAGQPGGIAFDLFQGQLSNTLSVTSVFTTATTQATLDIYHLADVNGNPITSFDKTNGNYDHPFVFGTTDGYACTSGCARMNGGVITCQSDDTAECDLPINCPEYLIDLVECVGTLSNEVYSKMISGLLKNNLSVKEVWMVMIIKYLINHLNPCITMQDLLSWTKFLEDICPDCEPSVTIPPIADDQGTPYGGGNITEFDF